MAQLQCIGLYKPCINPPFGDCAMYFDHGVSRKPSILGEGHPEFVVDDCEFVLGVRARLGGKFSKY